MVDLPSLSGREAIRALEKLGFRQVRQRGSHVVLRKDTPSGPVGCAIPLHSDLAKGTLRGALRQAKVEIEDFVKSL